jgi:hypothetical protein
MTAAAFGPRTAVPTSLDPAERAASTAPPASRSPAALRTAAGGAGCSRPDPPAPDLPA